MTRAVPTTSRPASTSAPLASRGWALAGVVGVTVAVTAALRPPVPGMSPALSTLLAIALGWAVLLALGPWRRMIALGRDRERVRSLATMVRAADLAAREQPDLPLHRDDDVGDLSRAIHDLILRARAAQRESSRLQRTMDESIRRETSRATLRLQREATTDPMTGLGNRRTLTAALEELFTSNRRRRGDTAAAMIIDVDNFKAVNDTLGHDVGDQSLVFLGRLLTSTLRTDDCAVRLGGDEFVVIMPNQSAHSVRVVAQRLRALFTQMPWPHTRLPRPTLSIGLADAWCGDAQGADELLRRADAALYASKEAGRDRITAFEDDFRIAMPATSPRR